MTIERRDLLRVATGGVCGAFLTPMPWKLLDDTANWSQNWSWTPKVPRGEVQAKYSTCTLCPAACGVKARCVGDRAVGIEGATAHPFSHGVLCPLGLEGHTLAYTQRPLSKTSTISDITARISNSARVGLLDLGPERSMSKIYQQAAEAFGNAVYLRVADRQEATLNQVAKLLDREPGSLGIDLEKTRTIVSIGAPILEGWATPGRVAERWRSGKLRIIHIEPRQSRTALAADRWIPSFEYPLIAGLNIEGPAVVVGSGDDPQQEEAIAALNLQFGTIGSEGGIVPRSPLPWKRTPLTDLASVPDRSLDVLFIDSSRAYDIVPWPAIRRKLNERAIIVSFAYRHDRFTSVATHTLPVAAPYECAEDAGTPPCAAVPSFAIAARLIETTQQTAADHLNAILKGLGKPAISTRVEDEQKQRAAAIYASKSGTVVSFSDGSSTKISELASADELWKKLIAGACWIGEPSKDKLPFRPVTAAGLKPRTITEAQRPFTLLVYRAPDETAPLSTKLYQESGLYSPAILARINPQTASGLGLASGSSIIIDTLFGSSRRQLLTDPAVMPGVIEATGDIADICTDGSDPSWRTVAANVRSA